MKNTKKYADLSELKWSEEDLDCNVEAALDSDEISPETAAKLLAMTEQEKIAFIEEAISGNIGEYLMELINNAIREKVSEIY